MTDLPYRPGVGAMLVNAYGLVFVGQRYDSSVEAWQMPQGGVDPGEEPDAAVLRELEEETGVVPGLVEIVACSAAPYDYDLPPELIGNLWKGKYRGQRQHWYLLRFLGTDADVDIATEHPEFKEWRWIAPGRLPDMIVPFKRALYEAIVAEFGPRINALQTGSAQGGA
jgi:putative (di)nucleoside polyphosphate hydrolase